MSSAEKIVLLKFEKLEMQHEGLELDRRMLIRNYRLSFKRYSMIAKWQPNLSEGSSPKKSENSFSLYRGNSIAYRYIRQMIRLEEEMAVQKYIIRSKTLQRRRLKTLPLMVRFTRHRPSDNLFIITVNVFIMEVIKFIPSDFIDPSEQLCRRRTILKTSEKRAVVTSWMTVARFRVIQNIVPGVTSFIQGTNKSTAISV
uniref:Uncharacterized protein n=1 Tax=Syphacia muris TaxID=451379 RepID=A0A0N5AE77_9BILA